MQTFFEWYLSHSTPFLQWPYLWKVWSPWFWLVVILCFSEINVWCGGDIYRLDANDSVKILVSIFFVLVLVDQRISEMNCAGVCYMWPTEIVIKSVILLFPIVWWYGVSFYWFSYQQSVVSKYKCDQITCPVLFEGS